MMSKEDVRSLLDRVKADILRKPEEYWQDDPERCIGGKIRDELGYPYTEMALVRIHEAVFGRREFPWLFQYGFITSPSGIDLRWIACTSSEERAKVAVEAIDIYFNEWVQKLA